MQDPVILDFDNEPKPFAVHLQELVADSPRGPQDSTSMVNPDTSTYRRDTDDIDT